ncbi:MAG: hypothetical protein H0T84_06980 [Tatlockia sp.]|nr:hypothetical protein [Tatlockia sp.]
MVDCSGQDRLEAMVLGLRSDINVICIDKSDEDSLNKAKKYALTITENNPKAKIIIAITKIDKNASFKVTDAEIQQFKQAFGIRKKTVYTSAKNNKSIDDMHQSIVKAGKQIMAKKPELVKPDITFLDAFQSNLIIYLNREKEAVTDAKKNGGLEQLSRIFDKLVLPISDHETFEEALDKAGSIMAYMRPTLNSAANQLLNENRTALNKDVIEAIGKVNYAALVSAEVQDGEIKPKPENERDFAKKEAEVARIVLSSIVLNYSKSLHQYYLSNDFRLNNMINDLKGVPKQVLVEDEKEEEIHTADLDEKISAIEEHINDGSLPIPEQVMVTNKKQEEEIKIADLADLSKKITAIEESIIAGVLPRQKLLENAEDLNCAANAYINVQNQKLNYDVFMPLQNMAKNFNFTMLDEPKGDLPTLAQVNEKIEIFYEMIEATPHELSRLSKQTSFDPRNIQKALKTLKDKLDTAKEIDVEFRLASANTKRDFKINIYQDAAEHFVKNLNEEKLKVDTPKPIMNVLFRLVRFLFIGSMHTEKELTEKKRIEKQINIKDELKAIKGNLPKEERSVEIKNNKF